MNIIAKRWKKKMPKFFKVISWVCGAISGTALAVNTAIISSGATPHEWWQDIFPYLVGFPAGMMFLAKFTVQGGMTEDENKNTILDKDNF